MALWISKGNVPALVSTTDCGAAAPPKIVLPNPTAVALNVANGRGTGTPFPDNPIALAPAAFCAFETILSCAFFAPIVAGLNTTSTVQLAPGTRPPHPPVRVKSLASTPLKFKPLTKKNPLPTLLINTRCGALLTPIIWSPKLSVPLNAISPTGVAMPMPLSATLYAAGVALVTICTLPNAAPTAVGLNVIAIAH